MSTYITRHVDEVRNDGRIVDKHQRPHGWMPWGCFLGAGGKKAVSVLGEGLAEDQQGLIHGEDSANH